MKAKDLRTALTIVLAIGSVALAAFLRARTMISTQNALDLAFFSWLFLDLSYGGTWRQFRKLGNRSVGQIYDAYRTGAVVPVNHWLSGLLTLGCVMFGTAMVVQTFM